VRVVVAIPAIGLLAGSALGLLLPDFPVIPGDAALVASTTVALWAWRESRSRVLAVSVGVAFLIGGALLSAKAWRQAWRPSLRVVFEELVRMEREDAAASGRIIPEDPGVSLALTGVLRDDASPREGGVSLSVDVTAVDAEAGPPRGLDRFPPFCSRRVEGGVLLTVVGDLARNHLSEWRAGRTVRVVAHLHRPARYLNPGARDEERSLARRGTTLVGTVKSGALVDVVSRGTAWAEAGAETRAFVRRAINTSVGGWNARAAGIVTAIVIGDRAGLDEDVQRRLQEAGTYHVIAISGGNIAILAGLTLGAFRVAGVLGQTAMLSAIAGLLAYAYLVGGGPSVERATLMAVVYLAARAIDLRGPSFNTLALVAAILVATDPLTIVDPGFLLTFGATTAILVAVPYVAARDLPFPLSPVAALFAATAAAEAALFPVSAMVFSRITFAGLLLNFAAIPLMALAQIAGMLLVPVSLVSSVVASTIGWVAYVGAEGLVRSADLVRLMPAVTWRVAPPHCFAVIVYYAALIACVVSGSAVSRSNWTVRAAVVSGFSWPIKSTVVSGVSRTISATLCAAAAVWILFEPWTLFTTRGDGRLHLTFIDVGQGDAAFVRFPEGDTLLVDAGGASGRSTFDVGDRVVAPVLRRAGVSQLGTFALTHGDADHIGGAGSLMAEFRAREVWEGIPVPPSAHLQQLRAIARRTGARWSNRQTADVLFIDDVEVAVRHPPIADWERQDIRNDDSIVLELRWGAVSIVLTGDIGAGVEETIAPLFEPSALRVVKVPHHGSLTSSSRGFLTALAPRIAVVSAGRNNTFGHPAPAVLERYREVGAEIFRTDRDGAVMIDTDGTSIAVKTFSGRKLIVP